MIPKEKPDELPECPPEQLSSQLLMLVTTLDNLHERLSKKEKAALTCRIQIAIATLAMAAGATAAEVASEWKSACRTLSHGLQDKPAAADKWDRFGQQLPGAEQLTEMVAQLRRAYAREDGDSCSTAGKQQ